MIKKAVVMLAVYDEITWQNKTIGRWKQYCDKNNVDFILIEDTGDILLPTKYKPVYKLAAIDKMKDSDYDSILFVDCDTVVEPSYHADFFESRSEPFVRMNQNTISIDEVNQFAKKGEYWLLIEHTGMENLGLKSHNYIYVSSSVFLCNPAFCSFMKQTLISIGLWPNNKVTIERIREALLPDTEVCDQFFWNIFYRITEHQCMKINWPYELYPKKSEFVTDLWYSKNGNRISELTESL